MLGTVLRATVIAVLLCLPSHADDVLRLCDFEAELDLKAWDFPSGAARLVGEGATHDRRAMEVTFDPKGRYYGGYLYWRRVYRDWSGYDALVLDVLNPGSEPVAGYVLVADQAWQDKGRTYWNRHNGGTVFAPGQTEWTIPVRGLYRGEAGSRNNDIKRNIDPDAIVRVDFGFGRKGTAGRIVIDNLRLVRAGRPEGVWAFDFGPPNQSVMLGWTPVSQQTRYTKERGFGWGPRGGAPWNGAARDTTFGTMLTQDFCEAGGYNFHIDAPSGQYRVTVIYENSGYWGGEQAMHRERRILADGKIVFEGKRDFGLAHALYRFEGVEPVGVDLWDTYMRTELAKPITFQTRAYDDGITLRFEADRVWGSKVSALALRCTDDPASEQWMEEQFEKLATEFRRKAVCLDQPPRALGVPAAWRDFGLVAWEVGIEDDVTPQSVPRPPVPAPQDLRLRRVAVRGETATICLAVRPLVDSERRFGVGFRESETVLRQGLSVVRYNTSRQFNAIAYRTLPHTLRPLPPTSGSLTLRKDVSRQLVLRVQIPESAPEGEYHGLLSIAGGVAKELLIPVTLDVRPVTLDRKTDFLMGFFGLMPPRLVPDEQRWDVLERTLVMLREHGMNAVSGGPSWRLTGWRNGEPVIDFGEMDRFFALLRKHGFVAPLNGYGGARFRGLHDRYEKGRTGVKVEKESGLPYEEALLRAWRAVDAHARKNDWPTIFYAMCDETRVRDKAERELAFMRMMAKVSAAFPKTVRTSGSYSVAFTTRPTSKSDLHYWHQRFFEALDISSLNRHDESVVAETRKLGKELHIYNQGRTRYSFGLYQWSEYRKGVRARWQWHLNILHGYQFFDLDGREPDTAMMCYGRNGLYPTIHFERCREGAEDFYLYNTLHRLVERRQKEGTHGPALRAGARLLQSLGEMVALNQRRPPEGFDADALKLEVVSAIEALSGAAGGTAGE